MFVGEAPGAYPRVDHLKVDDRKWSLYYKCIIALSSASASALDLASVVNYNHGLYYKHILTIVSDDCKWRQYYKCNWRR